MDIIGATKLMWGKAGSLKVRLREFIYAKRHHLSLFMFVIGFVVDNFTLPGATHPASHIIVVAYLLVCVTILLIVQFIEERPERMNGKIPTIIVSWAPPILQLCLGALFSALFIFYMRSSAFSGSWFFLLLFAMAALGNELFRTRSERLEFQFATIFLVLYAYLIYALPVAFSMLSPATFYLSGALAATIALLVFLLLLGTAPRAAKKALGRSSFAITVLLVLFNTFYVFNIIPPIPLVLKQANVYHGITKDALGRFIAREETNSAPRYLGFTPEFHTTPGGSASVFTAVFAPSQLTAPLRHEWQYRNAISGEWETRLMVDFPILGGREGGYRGYSEKTHIEEGVWRVIVKTGDGRRVGTISFKVVLVADMPTYKEVVL